MKSKKIKIIIAQALIISILLPNFSVKATTEVNNNESIINTVDEQGNEGVINTQDEENNTEIKEELKDDTSNISNETKENLISTIDEGNNDEAGVKEGTKYKKVPVKRPRTYSYIDDSEKDRIEFKLMNEALEEMEVLVPLTDSEYELTLAYSDGSYEYVNSFNNLDEAVNSAKSYPQEKLNNDILPAVINRSGQVVYSTNEMARITKYESNVNVVKNINIYDSPTLSNVVTYVNPGYVNDAPVLEYSGNAAKVLVNGREGWINNDKANGNYDMQVVPLNQVSNPSYYRVVGGELLHYITSDLTGSRGWEILVGKAPSYLREGVKYLSYDGIHFYDGSNIQNGLSLLISDYKAGVRYNSVNGSNPHHLYYQTLPFRSKSIYSADELNRYINNNTASNSKLRGMGQAFKEAEEKYGVNSTLMLAVSMNESAGGTSQKALEKNNLFGINATDSNPNNASAYASPNDSIVDFSKNYISNGYSNPSDWRYNGATLGNKNRGVNVRYASDPFWGEKAASYAYRIDRYLSNGTSNLRDTNSNKISIAQNSSTVVNRNGQALYNLIPNSYVVVNSLDVVNINGGQYYEINPDINLPKGTGYNGSYNWTSKGYVPVNSVSRVNVFRPGLDVRAGDRRYDTAVELSKSQFNSADTVVLAGGYALADGLAATPIATYYKSPLLLVETGNIPEVTKNEIKRLGAKNVIIVGGTTVVNKAVENQLLSMGVSKITRLGGANRYETSLLVAQYIDSNLYNIENIVVTNGLGEADALSIAPVAGRDGMPIILVKSNEIPSGTYNWVRGEGIKNAYIIGGTTAISNNVLNQVNGITANDISGNRLGGSTRYETNAFIIDKFYGNSTNKVYLSKGLQLIDALSSGPIAALENSPVVLANNDLTATQRSILSKRSTNVIVQAGYGISSNVTESLRDLLSSK
ncbi:cell wall-binding repeat-containing protein [Clostridium tertium]